MPRKGNLAVFEGSHISKTEKNTPTKIGVHKLDLNPYLHEFFESIPIDDAFGSHAWLLDDMLPIHHQLLLLFLFFTDGGQFFIM